MRILIVSPYPPTRDGIGAYAVQQGAALRAEGHHVEVLSPLPSAAHHHLELRGWRGPLALTRWMPRYDRVIVHFHLDMFYPAPVSRREKVAITAGLAAAFAAARRVDLIVHEIDYNWGRRSSMRRLSAAMLGAATHRMVHTETEKRRLCEAFGLAPGSVTVIEHGHHFVRRTGLDQGEARAVLGVPAAAFVFLAIGFVQPHKGFDRAITAFGELGAHGCVLYVVGSVRVEEPQYVAHLEDLRRRAAEREGVELRIEFVSDERFDEWLVASDVVLLPYRHIWSSSVLERARLYDRQVIASDVGGLRDQGYARLISVSTDDELAAAMHEAAGRQGAANPTRTRDPFSVRAGTSRVAVMEMLRARATRERRPRPLHRPPASPSLETVPLLRLGRIGPPPLGSRSAIRGAAKRFVDRLVRWQIEPLRLQLNALQDATIQVAEALAARDPVASPNDGAERGA